jgi:AraC family transcriptional regulator
MLHHSDEHAEGRKAEGLGSLDSRVIGTDMLRSPGGDHPSPETRFPLRRIPISMAALAGGSEERVLRTFDASGFVLTEKLFPARSRLGEHAHDDARFCFVVAGRYKEAIGRQAIDCAPSTLTFCPAGDAHSNEFYDEPVQVLTVEIPPRWMERVAQESIALPHALSIHHGLAPGLARRLAHEFQQMDSGASLLLEALSVELLVAAGRSTPFPSERTAPQWLERVRELIHARFAERLTLDEIGAHAGVHPVHLASVFRQRFHCTIGDYIRDRRIEYASGELTRSRTPLAMIALDAGFANQGHFSTTFKRITGFTPAAYRRTFGHA